MSFGGYDLAKYAKAGSKEADVNWVLLLEMKLIGP
jgi:hypothetical protein